MQTLKHLFSYLLAVAIGLILVGGLVVTCFILLTWPRLPSLETLTDYRPKMPLRVMSEEGQLLGEFGEERRSVVSLKQVPKSLQQAILAAEDANFYQHGGIDWQGVLRALHANLTGGRRQGASTITQQVAKNFFLSSEQTLTRKANEALLALKIEKALTKDQILELYINQIYLGQRAYGFASAANIYYGKTLEDLNLAETAMLAGLPKAPSAYNPIVNPTRAKTRQQYVLRRMQDLGFITEAQNKQAAAFELQHRRDTRDSNVRAEFVTEMVRQQVYDMFGDTAYTRGLVVETSLIAAEQEAAYLALRTGVLDYDRRHAYRGPEAYITLPTAGAARDEAIEAAVERAGDSEDMIAAVVTDVKPNRIELSRGENERFVVEGEGLRLVRTAITDKATAAERIRAGAVVRIHSSNGKSWRVVQLPQVEAALVSIDPEDGAIRALVGGFDFARNQYNHATQAMRQPGSAIKPFIFSAALEKGVTAADVYEDGPVKIGAGKTGSGEAWEPQNYDGKFEGPMRVRTALAKSKNSVTVQVMDKIGVSYAHDYIQKFGFDPKLNPAVYALALGAGAASPLQLASAYSVFANGGFRVKPYFVKRILDNKGIVVYEAKPDVAEQGAEQVIDPRNAYIMTNMLADVIRRGTATAANRLNRIDLAGKTGTTNDSVDAWFAGYNMHRVAITWMGFDQPRSLGDRETGGQAALPIWMNYMAKAMQGVDQDTPQSPKGLIGLRVPYLSENRLGESYNEYFYAEYPAKADQITPPLINLYGTPSGDPNNPNAVPISPQSPPVPSAASPTSTLPPAVIRP